MSPDYAAPRPLTRAFIPISKTPCSAFAPQLPFQIPLRQQQTVDRPDSEQNGQKLGQDYQSPWKLWSPHPPKNIWYISKEPTMEWASRYCASALIMAIQV